MTSTWVFLILVSLLPMYASAAALPPLKNATLSMRLGQRLSYIAASATVGRSGINLVPDANGRWVNISTGQVLPEGAGSGGAGISIIDICQFNNSKIIGDQTTYLFNTVTNSFTLAGHQVLQGNGQTLDIIWARPQNFAAFPDQNKPNFRVKRLRYTLDGRTFNAVRIQQNTGNGWIQSTYDLASGFLIIQSYAVHIDGGGTGLAFFRITSGKLLQNAPGINTNWPSSIKGFSTYNWLAKGSGGVFGAGSVSGQAAFTWSNMKWTSQVLTTTVKVAGKSQGTLQYVAGRFGSAWMSPNFLKTLKQNQEIDSESALQYRIFVSGVDSKFVSLKFANKNQNVTYKYNRNTGDLVSFNVLSSEGLFGSAATVSFQSRK